MIKYLLIILTLCGCYSRPVAVKQHGRAVSTYPEIGADYCARTYPCVDGTIKTDTVVTLDTIYVEPEAQILTDTVLIQNPFDFVTVSFKKDSVYLFHLNKWQVIKNKMPPQTIVKTVTIRDTIKVEDLAKLDLCNIERKRETERANSEQQLKEKFRGQRNKLRWVLAGIGAIGLIWLFFFIRRKVVKK